MSTYFHLDTLKMYRKVTMFGFPFFTSLVVVIAGVVVVSLLVNKGLSKRHAAKELPESQAK